MEKEIYTLKVYNTLTKQYEDVIVAKKVYDTYRTIDIRRLGGYIDHLNAGQMKKVDWGLTISLDLHNAGRKGRKHYDRKNDTLQSSTSPFAVKDSLEPPHSVITPSCIWHSAVLSNAESFTPIPAIRRTAPKQTSTSEATTTPMS